MMQRFEDRVVVVTGGGSGIGRATSLRAASEGAKVAIVERDFGRAELVVAEIRDLGGDAMGVHADVSDSGSVNRAVSEIEDQFGGVDVLVNNAGIHIGNLVHLVTDEEWQRVMDVNLTGSFYMARACQRSMVKRRYGKIVNVASQAALGTERGFSAYSASKAGVTGMTRALALDLGPFEINVNAVAPGHVETPLTHDLANELSIDYEEIRKVQIERNALPRVAQPEDLAAVILFLASDDARHVTGQVIYVTGRPNP